MTLRQLSIVALGATCFSVALAGHYSKMSGALMFSGPFAGVNLGVETNNDVFSSNGDGVKLSGGTPRANLGVFAGYNWALGSKYVMGGQVFYRTTLGYSSMGHFVDSGDSSRDSLKVSARNTLGLALTPSYLLSPRVMASLILGAENTNFRVRINDSDDGVSTTSERRWGFFPGLGVEYALCRNLHLGASYTYHFYSSYSKTQGDESYSLSPQRGDFNVTLSYHF